MAKILCFADAHIEHQDTDFSRFEALGNFIIYHEPEKIIDLGDTFSISCISNWDVNKRLTMEGRRYQLEVEAGIKAVDALFNSLELYNHQQRKNKVKLYRPEIIRIKGNHEQREYQYCEQHPEMHGMLDIDRDTGYSNYYSSCIPYKGIYNFNGINFTHCPLAGNDQPISGIHIPYKTLQRFNSHVIMGHYHRHEQATYKRIDAPHSHKAIICPAFFDRKPSYLSPNAPANSTAGILLIDIDDNNYPQVTEISMETLKRDYCN